MEEFTKQILKYDSRLHSDFQLVNLLFDQNFFKNTFYLSKIDRVLIKTIEDAQGIKEKFYSITNYYLIIIKNFFYFLILYFQYFYYLLF